MTNESFFEKPKKGALKQEEWNGIIALVLPSALLDRVLHCSHAQAKRHLHLVDIARQHRARADVVPAAARKAQRCRFAAHLITLIAVDFLC
jgi:hypothetical protein